MENPTVVQTNEINIIVGLDENKVPVDIVWTADNKDGTKENQACKAMLLSLFDGVHQETLKIDLWTKDMMVSEMDRFMFQTLRALSETYFKASQNAALANEMQRFVQYFGEKTEVISPEKP
ncbi:MAG: gliding motility protein GldC [Bacteroidota bacterium]|jgi:gliding motility-associated protein GldC